LSLDHSSAGPDCEPPQRAPGESPYQVSPAESAIIQFFVHAATSLGAPKSIGELFGLLYCAESSLSFDEIVTRLAISRGSASQGLRFLQGFHAVQTSSAAGDRRTYYEAEASLRRLVSGLLQSKVDPHLATAQQRLEAIHKTLITQESEPNLASREDLLKRVEALTTWHRAARELLPGLAQVAAPSRQSGSNSSGEFLEST
jgi:DNA-binding transcriptional regulator GbsR (MarR family)